MPRKEIKHIGQITIEGSYEVKVIGADGKIKQVVKGKAHSLVRNALKYLYGQLASKSVTLKDLTNGNLVCDFAGAVAVSGYKWCYGVGCGESNQAYDIDDYELITKYREVLSLSFDEYQEADGTGYWIVTGGIEILAAKTIWEICLYGYVNDATQFTVARDVLGAGVAVVNGDTLAVTYKLKTKNA